MCISGPTTFFFLLRLLVWVSILCSAVTFGEKAPMDRFFFLPSLEVLMFPTSPVFFLF